jgi:hypothetical protein
MLALLPLRGKQALARDRRQDRSQFLLRFKQASKRQEIERQERKGT